MLARDTLADAVIGADIRETGAAWEAMVPEDTQPRPPGHCLNGDRRSGYCALGHTRRAPSTFRCIGCSARSEIRSPSTAAGASPATASASYVRSLAGWAEQGIPRVKIKIGKDRGTSWEEDIRRVRAAREAVGDDVELFVDANGAYRPQAGAAPRTSVCREFGVTWFEEPVTSDDREGLSALRAALPLEVSAGEYGYDLEYFQTMLRCHAVDVLQADAGRCAGITEWLRVAATSAASRSHSRRTAVPRSMRMSRRYRPICAISSISTTTYAWITSSSTACWIPTTGLSGRDDDRPGLGLALKEQDAERFRVLDGGSTRRQTSAGPAQRDDHAFG